MGRKHKFLIASASMLFWFHLSWVVFVVIGIFYRLPGILWEIHLLTSALLVIGVIADECPLTKLERWTRRVGGQENVSNRGSRLLEALYNATGIKLPNIVMKAIGFFGFVFGVLVHFIH